MREDNIGEVPYFELETEVHSNSNEVLEHDIDLDDLAMLYASEEET